MTWWQSLLFCFGVGVILAILDKGTRPLWEVVVLIGAVMLCVEMVLGGVKRIIRGEDEHLES
jgi:hypothetical protein